MFLHRRAKRKNRNLKEAVFKTVSRKRKKMKTVSSYGVELRKQNIPIRQTLDIYRSAVSCLIEIYAQAWDELAVIT